MGKEVKYQIIISLLFLMRSSSFVLVKIVSSLSNGTFSLMIPFTDTVLFARRFIAAGKHP